MMDNETMRVQWFPGHMAKTRRLMAANLKMVDIVVELTDARIPRASRNPEIDKLLGKKPRVLLLNKCDAADAAVTAQWCVYYEKRGITALPTDCRTGKGLAAFMPAVRKVLAPQIENWERNGTAGRPIRMMIVGVPNVGKSSLINRLAKSKRAKVEDRPGVTRGKQWVTLDSGAELLDMPGVLWPKFEDKIVGEHLAFTGAVKDDILDIEYLAVRLLETLPADYRPLLCKRYNLDAAAVQDCDGFALLEMIAKGRGMLRSGGTINTERAAIMLLDEFRSGKIGNMTLEHPSENGAKRSE